nr:YchJ family metal-binding protein [Hoyosella sp. YIM 151337]
MRPNRNPPYPANKLCPCRHGEPYANCCSPIIHGAPAPTALQLMRSRYTAFAVGATDHLLSSWHPSTRPSRLELDPQQTWRRLDIVRTIKGGPFDTDGVVEFRAHYRHLGHRDSLHEVSRFVREQGRWFYVDGQILP